jgi:NTP pyrophosphatase (non-canonical NTP hydrolase)
MKTEQKIVNDWIQLHGVRYFNELTNTVLLMEEVGEMSRYIARVYGEQSFKDSEKKQDAMAHIKEEMADILFVIFCLANQMNIDLDEAFQNSIQKKTIRDKTRHKDNDKLK